MGCMSVRSEIKVFNNVLSGKIKVISANRVVFLTRTVEGNGSSRQRIKDSFLLLRLIQRLKARQRILMVTRKKIIPIQVDSIIRR